RRYGAVSLRRLQAARSDRIVAARFGRRVRLRRGRAAALSRCVADCSRDGAGGTGHPGTIQPDIPPVLMMTSRRDSETRRSFMKRAFLIAALAVFIIGAGFAQDTIAVRPSGLHDGIIAEKEGPLIHYATSVPQGYHGGA